MKKIAAAILSLCIILTFSATAFAQTTDSGGTTVISTVVPDSHTITIVADGAEVSLDGTPGTNFTVDRLSEHTLTFKAGNGKEIKKILLNDEDITNKITDGKYILEGVYEDISITVITQNGGNNPNSPLTGDKSNTWLWFVILFAAGTAALCTKSYGRQKSNKY